jgi:hypothetical protein
MLQRRTRAPFPTGAILIAVLLLALIVYYWITNKPAPTPSDALPETEVQDTGAQDSM